MDSKLTQRSQSHQGGYVLVAVAALTTVLLATGIAFMRWSTDEQLQSRESTAAMQAYYLAQMGVVEKGFMYLRAQKETELPSGDIPLQGERVHVGDEYPQADYEDVHVYGMTDINQGDFWTEDRRFRISAVGKVRIPVYDNGRSDYKDIKRKAVLYVQVRSFADYMYLSDCELTWFGDRIKFFAGDTLQGRVHSNSEIAIMDNPQFYGQVSSTACDFWRGPNFNPNFHGLTPQFRADTVLIPQLAENLRMGAASQGNFYSTPGKSYRVSIRGGSVTFFTWDTGTPFDSTVRTTIPIAGRLCMFFDGPTELYGHLTGQLTIGSSNILRLIDDVYYDDAAPLRPNTYGRVPLSSRNVLGIVSEADVKVANTPANGRENSSGRGLSQNNLDSTSIFIDGAVVALGESFTFENQNDADSGYVYQNPPGTPARDDRGQIYLFGSLTQKRRGYVHRGTNGSTGYLKQYVYDFRFDHGIKPPCFFHVTDQAGRALFDVVQWGEGTHDRQDETNWKLQKYN